MRSYRTDLLVAFFAAGSRSMVKHQRSSAGRGGRAMSGKEAVRTYKRLAKRWQARAARRPASSRLLLAKWRDGALDGEASASKPMITEACDV